MKNTIDNKDINNNVLNKVSEIVLDGEKYLSVEEFTTCSLFKKIRVAYQKS